MTRILAQIDELQSEMLRSADTLRELVKRETVGRRTDAEKNYISGSLRGPVAFPPKPSDSHPLRIADALHVHIPIDSNPGTYSILFGIVLLSPAGLVVTRSMLAWPVEPHFGPDFGWAPTAQDVPGQSAGQYTIVSLLTLVLPEGHPLQLDAKSCTLTIAP